MKLYKLILARKVLKVRSNEKMPANIAYKFMKFLKLSEIEEELYENRIKEIIKEYAIKDENGNIQRQGSDIKIKPALIKEFDQKIKELQTTEVDAPKIRFIIDDFSCFQMSIEEMTYLSEFIDKKGEEDDE